MARTIGYSIIAHKDDGSTEVVTKVPGERITLAPAGAAPRGSKYEYINADECPEHGPWRAVPGGISRAGKEYRAFWACDQPQGEERCKYKPSREWVETHPPERAAGGADQADPPEPKTPPKEKAGDFDNLPF